MGGMPADWSESISVIELADEPALSDEIAIVLDRLDGPGPHPHLVLDFGRVSYINSSNIAALLKLRKGMAAAGRAMKICSVNDEIWSVFLVTGLDKVFRFAPDPMTALAGLQIEQDQRGG